MAEHYDLGKWGEEQGLFANIKGGEEVLKKLQDSNEE